MSVMLVVGIVAHELMQSAAFTFRAIGSSAIGLRGNRMACSSVMQRGSSAGSVEGGSGGDSSSSSSTRLGPMLSILTVAVAGTAVAMSSAPAAEATPLVTAFARSLAPEQKPLFGDAFAPIIEGFARKDEDRSAGMFYNNNRLLPLRQKLDHMNADSTLVFQAGIPLVAAALASRGMDQTGQK